MAPGAQRRAPGAGAQAVTLRTFFENDLGCSLVIDDDKRVVWAYLRSPDDDIVGDVWLYNRVAPDADVDWDDVSRAPFLNPPHLARPFEGPPPTWDDFEVRWTYDGPLLLADVYVHGALLARLSPGSAPGWNVLALADGPCAQRFPPPDADDA